MKVPFDELSPLQRELLTQHARRQKESIAAGGVRSLTVVPGDVGIKAKPCTVSVTTYFKRLDDRRRAGDRRGGRGCSAARPRRVPASRRRRSTPSTWSAARPACRWSSKLLAARFPGLRQVMTDKPFTATAMGAAIHATDTVTMHDILSRHFGVIRLADDGQREVFDPIFAAGMQLPPRGTAPVERRVEYSPRHNIGHLRYLECATVDDTRPPRARRADVVATCSFPTTPRFRSSERVTASDVRDRDDLRGHRHQRDVRLRRRRRDLACG